MTRIYFATPFWVKNGVELFQRSLAEIIALISITSG